MRSMANNIAALLLLIALVLPSAASSWDNEDSMVEPPRDRVVGWSVNEIPANVTVYYDVTGDGVADLVFAHPIVSMNTGVYCNAAREPVKNQLLFTTCPVEHAADYFVTKQWTLYKFVGGNWSRVYQYIERDERTGACSIREGQPGAGCPHGGAEGDGRPGD